MSVSHKQKIKNEYIFFLAFQFSVLLTAMNTSMFNVALPFIARDFVLLPSQVSWIVTVYSITFAIGALIYSRLTHKYSIRRLLTIGLCLFGAGSLLGMAASNLYILIAARFLQACGACCTTGLGMIITHRYIPKKRRGAAMGKIISSANLAFALGPLVGGVVTAYWGWNILFLITIVSLFMLPIYNRLLPKEREEKQDHQLDLVGIFLLSMGVVSILLFITGKGSVFLIGLIALGLFWRHIHQSENPFISPDILRERQYFSLLAIGFGSYFVIFSFLFLIPLMVESLFRANAADMGMALFPGAFATALTAIFIGRRMDRIGSSPVFVAGILLMGFGTLLFSSFGYMGKWYVSSFFFLISIGFACISCGIPHYLSNLLPEQFTMAIGLQQLTQLFGGAFGTVYAGAILDVKMENAINGFWKSYGFAYSNAVLFLELVVLLVTGLIIWLVWPKKDQDVHVDHAKSV